MQQTHISQISQKKSPSFITLKNYKSSTGEIADYKILFRIKYESLVEKSIIALAKFNPQTEEEVAAKNALLSSLSKSIQSIGSDSLFSSYKDDSGVVVPGLKVNNKTNKLFIFGRLISKKVTQPGKTKSSSLSVKDKLYLTLPVSKYRIFEVSSSKISSIVVDNNTITI